MEWGVLKIESSRWVPLVHDFWHQVEGNDAGMYNCLLNFYAVQGYHRASNRIRLSSFSRNIFDLAIPQDGVFLKM